MQEREQCDVGDGDPDGDTAQVAVGTAVSQGRPVPCGTVRGSDAVHGGWRVGTYVLFM